jgi:hypothetical protein
VTMKQEWCYWHNDGNSCIWKNKGVQSRLYVFDKIMTFDIIKSHICK